MVEDDEGTLETYASMLRLEGFAVVTAHSAEVGLSEVATSHPDAILVDFRMPDMNGGEFVRRLRARKTSRRTPVAVVTGDYLTDELTALEALGVEVCFKPLWLDDLVTLVRRLLASQTDAPADEAGSF